MTRRGFLLLPALAAAQNARPRLALIWTTGAIPEAFARGAIVFPRAYAACPAQPQATWAIEHGRFPHATDNAPSLWDYFERAPAGDNEAIAILTSHSADNSGSAREASVRIPLAIRWPRHFAPRIVNETLISHVDLLPTLLGLFRLPAPPVAQGRDLSPWLAGTSGPKPDAVYSEGALGTREEWRALIRGFDKLVWNLRDEILGFYNLADDPREQQDLKDKREHRVNRDSMIALARQWMERLNDGIDPYGLRTRHVEN